MGDVWTRWLMVVVAFVIAGPLGLAALALGLSLRALHGPRDVTE
jgi:hypothetical protein